MRLIFDENVPKLVVNHFRTLKVDLKTVNELKLNQTSDTEIVKRSNKLRRTLVTRDLGLVKVTSYQDATKHGLVILRKKGAVTPQLLNVVSDFVEDFKKRSLKEILIIIDEEKYEIFRGKFDPL